MQVKKTRSAFRKQKLKADIKKRDNFYLSQSSFNYICTIAAKRNISPSAVLEEILQVHFSN